MGSKRLLNATELAEQLGVERSTVLRLVRQRRIPAFRASAKIVRFDFAQVLQAMTQQKKKPKPA